MLPVSIKKNPIQCDEFMKYLQSPILFFKFKGSTLTTHLWRPPQVATGGTAFFGVERLSIYSGNRSLPLSSRQTIVLSAANTALRPLKVLLPFFLSCVLFANFILSQSLCSAVVSIYKCSLTQMGFGLRKVMLQL